MSIRLFIPPGAFEPEALAAMSEAFEAACKELQYTGPPEVVREAIAARIIAAAKLGERNAVRLLEAAPAPEVKRTDSAPPLARHKLDASKLEQRGTHGTVA